MPPTWGKREAAIARVRGLRTALSLNLFVLRAARNERARAAALVERKRIMHRRLGWAGVGVSIVLACSSESGDGASGGTAGRGATSGAGTTAAGGTGGIGGTGGTGCVASGTGHVRVTVRGLPEGVPANLLVSGPIESQAVAANRTLDVAAGPYLLTQGPVTAPDPIVRSLYAPSPDALDDTEFCLVDGNTRDVTVEYVRVPTSHALWTNGSNGDAELFAFAAPSLAASERVEPSLSARGGAGKDIAFDVAGNLWSMGATVAESHLMRFAREAFVSSGAKAPDRQIDIDNIECLPALRAFTFDAQGSLWVSTCGGRIVALTAGDLALSGPVAPDLSFGGLSDNGDLAFDIQRNLWVTDGETIVRYDAAHLGTPNDGPPEARLTIGSELDARVIVPSHLAFDITGDLWVIDVGGNRLARIASAELEAAGSRAVVAETTLTLAVSALLERPAFDESRGLWIALDQNRFGRLSDAQLAISSDAGAPTLPDTIISSSAIGYANRMALFPAPSGLPLYPQF
jgi:hypothetical protein